MKTCLRLLLSKYGIMSIEMQRAYIEDSSDVISLADEAIEADGDVFEAEVMTEETTEA